jgi:hypothetical protein
MANLWPTVLQASLSRNAAIPNTRNSVNGASPLVRWAYSARARMSTFFVTTVRTPSGPLSTSTLTTFHTEFGLYVDRHGDPNLTKGTIEWEGTADHVAWHPPYVLIFKSHSIEVRLVDTGKLCQIIRGQDLQCTWDGYRSLVQTVQTHSPDSDGTWDETPAQGEHVHGVMRADDGSHGHAGSFDTAGGVKQNVFVLIPRIRILSSLEDPAPPT